MCQSIRLGRLVPGQRLIEGDLSRDLGFSRGTIREAFKRLAAEGVIALTPHRGAYVRALTRTEAMQLTQVLGALLGLGASLAAIRINEGDNRKKLTVAYERLRKDGATSDRVLYSVDHNSFYDVLFTVAGNDELKRINPDVPTQLLRLQVHPFLLPQDLTELFSDYPLLYRAIVAGDSKKAQRLAQKHLKRRRAQIERLPAEAFVTPH